jgi:hypothetical protein
MEGHTAVFDRNNAYRMLVFGGHNGTTIYDKVWQMRRDDPISDTYDAIWTWSEVTTAPDPVNGTPAGRYNHAAILTSDSDRRMIIVGGRNASGPLADCWQLDLKTNPPQWTRLADLPSGDVTRPSGARYGLSAVFDQGWSALDTGDERMIVFGGRDDSANPYRPDDTWQLSLPLAGAPTWSQLPSSGSPREGQSAVFSWGSDHYNCVYRRMWVFGGRNASGLLGDVMEFRGEALDPFYPCSTYPSGSSPWRTMAPGNWPGVSPPAPRAGQSAIFESLDGRMLSFGGETAAGPNNEVWYLYFVKPSQEGDWHFYWRQAPSTQGGFSGPGNRTGQTLVYNDAEVNARVPELFTHDAAGTSGSWSSLSSAKWFFPTYPQVFQLPSGKVASVGPLEDTYLMDPKAQSPGWNEEVDAPSPPTAFSFSSVSFRPGSIMKTGGYATSPTMPAAFTGITDTIQFHADGTNSGWTRLTPDGFARTTFNLTLLPTGEVLATSGTYGDPNASPPSFQQHPQIWDPANGWGRTDLPVEPARRGYHSTAILLPDGRVMTGGGFASQTSDLNTGSIYEPYYLFQHDPNSQSGSSYAAQPVITSAPSQIEYGQSFAVGTATPGAIGGVCLIKASAVTHGFNMGQLFVPLSFTVGSGALQVLAPPNSNYAPPGDYLLFIVNSSLQTPPKVPSVAKWVRLIDVGNDQSPPSTIGLDAYGGCYDHIFLQWLAPSDVGADGTTGPATNYDLRWSTSPITATNFVNSTQLSTATPSPPGTQEQLTVGVPRCSAMRYYAIKARDAAGNWSVVSSSVSARPACPVHSLCIDDALPKLAALPTRMDLARPAPNPALTSTQLAFDVPAKASGEDYEIAIYDIAGRRIAMVDKGTAVPGHHAIGWDLRSDAGQRLRAGLYFVRFTLGQESLTRTLVSVK